MLHKTEIQRHFVHAFTEIQNPKKMLNIPLPVSRQISAGVPLPKIFYKTEIHKGAPIKGARLKGAPLKVHALKVHPLQVHPKRCTLKGAPVKGATLEVCIH